MSSKQFFIKLNFLRYIKKVLNYRSDCAILSPDKEIKVELQEESYGKGSIC